MCQHRFGFFRRSDHPKKAVLTHRTPQTLCQHDAVTIMKRTFRRLMLGGWLLLAGAGAVLSPTAFAQDAAPKSGVVTTSGSNRIFEYGIVIAVFGGALFAVCRSSRRNV